MPEKDKNILKYYYGEKSLKAPFALYADFECLLIKEQSFKTILKNPILREKLSMNLQDTHWVQFIHLIRQKTSTMYIEEKTVSNIFVKNKKSLEQK